MLDRAHVRVFLWLVNLFCRNIPVSALNKKEHFLQKVVVSEEDDDITDSSSVFVPK